MVAILLAASDLNQRGVMRWLGPRAGKVQVFDLFWRSTFANYECSRTWTTKRRAGKSRGGILCCTWLQQGWNPSFRPTLGENIHECDTIWHFDQIPDHVRNRTMQFQNLSCAKRSNIFNIFWNWNLLKPCETKEDEEVCTQKKNCKAVAVGGPILGAARRSPRSLCDAVAWKCPWHVAMAGKPDISHLSLQELYHSAIPLICGAIDAVGG